MSLAITSTRNPTFKFYITQCFFKIFPGKLLCVHRKCNMSGTCGAKNSCSVFGKSSKSDGYTFGSICLRVINYAFRAKMSPAHHKTVIEFKFEFSLLTKIKFSINRKKRTSTFISSHFKILFDSEKRIALLEWFVNCVGAGAEDQKCQEYYNENKWKLPSVFESAFVINFPNSNQHINNH